jgi:NTE family protein
MEYHFRNLVFEGGGVKGLAYVGALEVLEEKRILAPVRRIGGTSAGAINAVLLALGYSRTEQDQILRALDFNKFMDSDWGFFRDAIRLINEFGWYKGDYFGKWIGGLIKGRLGHEKATFRDLHGKGGADLYILGTNLATGQAEIFSIEHTPDHPIAAAVRISMSIPLFFRAVRGPNKALYVDGGVLDNYPVKLFDQEKYIAAANLAAHGRTTDYYEKENIRRRGSAHLSPYIYNRETLGFRLDSGSEIKMFRDGAAPPAKSINSFVDYVKALMGTLLEVQGHQHLHSDDWHRTIYIDSIGVGTTQFDLSDSTKDRLVESGRKFTRAYFEWYDKEEAGPANKPATASSGRKSA